MPATLALQVGMTPSQLAVLNVIPPILAQENVEDNQHALLCHLQAPPELSVKHVAVSK